MFKKTTQRFVRFVAIPASVMAVSCIDGNYDLNKEIDMTVSLGGAGITIPIGYTDSVLLQDIIDTTSSSSLKLDDEGIFSIDMNDEIDPVDIEVEDPTINIDDPEFSGVTVEFEENSVEDVQIDPTESQSTVESSPQTDVSDISLPTMDQQSQTEEVIPANTPGDLSVSVEKRIIDNQKIHTTYENYPEDVRTINEISFGQTAAGDILTFKIDVSDIQSALKSGTQRIKDFTITFPKEFKVRKANDSFTGEMISQNVYRQQNQPINGAVLYQFYVEKVTFSSPVPEPLNITQNIHYELNYALENAITKGTNTEAADVKVSMEQSPFHFRDALVTTNNISADFEADQLEIKSNLTGLEDIHHVSFVTFHDSDLKIKIGKVDLPIGFSGGSIEVLFPESYELGNPDHSDVTYANHILNIPATLLNEGCEISMPIKKVNINQDVVNDAITLQEEVIYRPSSQGILLQGDILTSEVMQSINANLDIVVNCGDDEGNLVVENSQVISDIISAEVEDHTDFEVNEEVDEALKRIKEVVWDEPVAMEIAIDFINFPSSEIRHDISLKDITIELPRFITFAPEEGITDGILKLNDTHNPNQGPYTRTLKITGMDFTQIPDYAEGLEIKDGQLFIDRSLATVNISGKVKTTEREEIDTDQLHDFTVQPKVTIPEMQVSKVVGQFDPEIDDVAEVVELDLGEDMDFLKEDGTVLDIENPQFKICLTNTVGVPVDMHLTMQGENLDGSVIENSQVTVDLKDNNGLAPAVDGNPVTTVFYISRKGMSTPLSQQGDTVYRNITVSNLSDLIKRIPDNIRFDMTARVNQNQEHSIDLSKELKITGSYDVVVPLAFNDLNIAYGDTIKNLQEDISDFLEQADDMELVLRGNLCNGIPLLLELNATAMDQYGNQLNPEEVSLDIMINGEKNGIIAAPVVEGQAVTSSIEIHIKASGESLSRLDMIKWNVNVSKDDQEQVSTTGGIALKGKQFLQFRDLKATLKKLTLDLN